jgi:hypothetical protein
MVPGIDWTGDLSQWLRYEPRDPLHDLAASFHNYEGPDLGSCHLECWDSVIAPVAAVVPVVTGEFGDADLSNQVCNHDYSDQYMAWADEHRVSYLAWTWDATAPGYWTCGAGPALIVRYDGTPTGYGAGIREHLLAISRAG